MDNNKSPSVSLLAWTMTTEPSNGRLLKIAPCHSYSIWGRTSTSRHISIVGTDIKQEEMHFPQTVPNSRNCEWHQPPPCTGEGRGGRSEDQGTPMGARTAMPVFEHRIDQATWRRFRRLWNQAKSYNLEERWVHDQVGREKWFSNATRVSRTEQRR